MNKGQIWDSYLWTPNPASISLPTCFLICEIVCKSLQIQLVKVVIRTIPIMRCVYSQSHESSWNMFKRIFYVNISNTKQDIHMCKLNLGACFMLYSVNHGFGLFLHSTKKESWHEIIKSWAEFLLFKYFYEADKGGKSQKDFLSCLTLLDKLCPLP